MRSVFPLGRRSTRNALSFVFVARGVMFSLRFRKRVQILPAVLLASVAFASVSAPARADDTATAAHTANQARRPASFGSAPGAQLVGSVPSSRQTMGYANGFLFLPGPQPTLNVGGRVQVGKSHVYVPYYGDVTGDPQHPAWQGAAGIAYGFRTWDISVVNGGFGNVQNAVPGAETPKTNPSLTLSIRF